MELVVPYALVLVILVVEALTFNTRSGTVRKDAFSHFIITILFGFGYGTAFTIGRRPPFLGAWALYAGSALALAGTAFRFWSVRVLGAYFTRTVQVSTDQEVVEAGPYRYIRHPSYSGSLLACLGVSLALRSVLSIFCLMIPAFLAMGYRIIVEERALAETLGEPYRSYMRRTKRLVPFIF